MKTAALAEWTAALEWIVFARLILYWPSEPDYRAFTIVECMRMRFGDILERSGERSSGTPTIARPRTDVQAANGRSKQCAEISLHRVGTREERGGCSHSIAGRPGTRSRRKTNREARGNTVVYVPHEPDMPLTVERTKKPTPGPRTLTAPGTVRL